MTIECNKCLFALDGTPLTNGVNTDAMTVGQAVSFILSTSTSNKMDVLKKYVLSKKFYDQMTVELDAADKASLVALLKDAPQGPLLIGQLIEILEAAK